MDEMDEKEEKEEREKRENTTAERVAAFVLSSFVFFCLITAIVVGWGISPLSLLCGVLAYVFIEVVLFYFIFIEKIRIRFCSCCYGCYGRCSYYDATETITNPKYSYLPQNIYHRIYRIYKDK